MSIQGFLGGGGHRRVVLLPLWDIFTASTPRMRLDVTTHTYYTTVFTSLVPAK